MTVLCCIGIHLMFVFGISLFMLIRTGWDWDRGVFQLWTRSQSGLQGGAKESLSWRAKGTTRNNTNGCGLRNKQTSILERFGLLRPKNRGENNAGTQIVLRPPATIRTDVCCEEEYFGVGVSDCCAQEIRGWKMRWMLCLAADARNTKIFEPPATIQIVVCLTIIFLLSLSRHLGSLLRRSHD